MIPHLVWSALFKTWSHAGMNRLNHELSLSRRSFVLCRLVVLTSNQMAYTPKPISSLILTALSTYLFFATTYEMCISSNTSFVHALFITVQPQATATTAQF